MNEETNIEIMPEFLGEVQEVGNEYQRAIALRDYAKAEEIINFPLRSLLQRQITYMSLLANTPYMVVHPNFDMKTINRSDLIRKRDLLISFVLDDSEWAKFSQKLKERGNFEIGVIQNAN